MFVATCDRGATRASTIFRATPHPLWAAVVCELGCVARWAGVIYHRHFARALPSTQIPSGKGYTREGTAISAQKKEPENLCDFTQFQCRRHTKN